MPDPDFVAAVEPKLERSVDRWRNMVPTAVMAGSPAQIQYALEDARKDILALDAARAALLAARAALLAWGGPAPQEWRPISELPYIYQSIDPIEVCNIETGKRAFIHHPGGMPDKQFWRDAWTHWKRPDALPEARSALKAPEER